MRISPAIRSSLARCRRRSAMVLIEVSVGLGALLMVAILLMRYSLNVAVMDRWTIVQSLTDSYMTREVALGKRYPFTDFTTSLSPWPTYPTTSDEVVTFGRLPGGVPITGTVYRTKKPSANNLASAGGSGTDATNPAAMESWVLQSYISYQVGERNYVKSRSIVRSR